MKRPVLARLAFRKLWIPVLVGGIAFQFSGCDPTVRDTVLTGLQASVVGLVTALLNGFFLSLSGSSESSTSQPVVQAVFDSLQTLLA